MTRFGNRGKKDDQIFFTDNVNKQEQEAISKAFLSKDTDIEKIFEKLVNNGFTVKITWSDYNDSFSCTVSPTEREHPAYGTFYSAFHAKWQKALFLLDYLLASRYDYGDWTKDRAKRFDNNW